MDTNYKPKSFWQRPEGVTGALFAGGFLIGGGIFLFSILPALVSLTTSILGLTAIVGILALVVYMALDSKARGLVWYFYKSVMRWVTGLFVQIDPIAILKNYVDEMTGNLKKMNKQILQLRGQMHKLKELILNNQKEIKSNLNQANEAKAESNKQQVILKSRKAGRLRDSNMKLDDLYRKMEVLYRVLKKMYENSEILKEDVADQVEIKEQELKAMKASHSAMSAAMSVIRGDKDKRAMFEMALEAVTDDVSAKVGEMERFMEMSESFMQSIDLQNGIFEEEGLKMLEQWEQENSLLIGEDKEILMLEDGEVGQDQLDLNNNESLVSAERLERANQYDSMFD